MRAVLFGLSFVALSSATGALAQDADAPPSRFDVQLFEAPAALGTTFTIDRPQVPRHLSYTLGLAGHAAFSPLDRTVDDESIVRLVGQAEVLFAVGLFEILELGVAVPLVLTSATDAPRSSDLEYKKRVSVGDVRLSTKLPLLRGDFALASQLVVSLPSGRAASFGGSPAWVLLPGLTASWKIAKLVLGAEAGYRMRRRAVLGDLEVDDEIEVALGATYPVLGDSLLAVLEGRARLGVSGRTFSANENPVELDAGLRFPVLSRMRLDVGGGLGLGKGYAAPDARVFAIVRYASEAEPCAAGPEDYDGFEDGDFCADVDNDRDTVVDEADECPNDSEDGDGFLDRDGCPDTDNDADGVPDGADGCPMQPEDLDGWNDTDGCPEPDNDDDEILDGRDQCPMEPEDRDRFQDEDGCPEPGPEQLVVTVTDTRILISERIYFDFDRDTIRSVSMPLLDQVADVIRKIDPRRRIRVEGYTDAEGTEEYNVDLSYRRARSVVEYLTSKRVPRERLEFVGYGRKNPVAPNDSPEGRALNRRVEFTIMEPGER